MGNEITQAEIDRMTSSRVAALIKHLIKTKQATNESEALEILENLRTYRYLLLPATDFFWKSIENLIYLVEMEIAGNDEEWDLNA